MLENGNDSDGEVINRTSSNLRNVEYIDMKINPIGLDGRLYTICKDYDCTIASQLSKLFKFL